MSHAWPTPPCARPRASPHRHLARSVPLRSLASRHLPLFTSSVIFPPRNDFSNSPYAIGVAFAASPDNARTSNDAGIFLICRARTDERGPRRTVSTMASRQVPEGARRALTPALTWDQGSRWRPTPTSPRRRAARPAPATPARPGRGGDQRERWRPHPPALPQGRGVRRRHRRGGGEGPGPAGRQAGGDAGVEDPRGGGGGAVASGI